MKLSSRTIAAAVGVVILGLIVLFAVAKPSTQIGDPNKLIGKPAPAFAGPDLNGKQVSLEQYRGSWLVVNFFATYCVPCRQENPELIRFAARHRTESDAAIVAIAYEKSETASVIRDFFVANGGDWPVVLGQSDRVPLDYGVTGLPESFLVDPFGTVVYKFVGGVTADELDAVLNQARAASGAS